MSKMPTFDTLKMVVLYDIGGGGSQPQDSSATRHRQGSGSPSRRNSGQNDNKSTGSSKKPSDSPTQNSLPKSASTLGSHGELNPGLASPESGYSGSVVGDVVRRNNSDGYLEGMVEGGSQGVVHGKERYSQTFPPNPQCSDDSKPTHDGSRERKEKRVTVGERLKSSSDLMQDNSVHEQSGSSSKDRLESVLEKVSTEEFIKLAFEKGIISKEDIMKMTAKMAKRKPSVDATPQIPLKAFSTDDMSNELNDSGRSTSKIPVYSTPASRRSSDSDDKSKTDTTVKKKVFGRSESFSGVHKKRPSGVNRKDRDSSGNCYLYNESNLFQYN
jgi:hypothetical protein